MKLRSESDLEDILFAEWRELREAGRLDSMLPRCTTAQYVYAPDRTVGYVTIDFQVRRQVRIPGGGVTDGLGIADFVEQYWSVRTINGKQDPAWPPTLNVNVVELKNEAVTSAHCEQVMRYSLCLLQAFHYGRQDWFGGERPPAQLFVRALLLGPSIGRDAGVICALTNNQVPIATRGVVHLTAARFSFSASRGFLFEEPDNLERFWSAGVSNTGELMELGRRLIGSPELAAQGFTWSGTNSGPILDYRPENLK